MNRMKDLPPMHLLRSEQMILVQLIIPVESAHDTVTYLAHLGLLQFKDLNSGKSAFQRTYANQVKRCGEMARKLRYFKDQTTKAGIQLAARPTTDKDFDLEELEVKFSEFEAELREIEVNSEKLNRRYNELTEFQTVLHKAGRFFNSHQSEANGRSRFVEDSDGEGAVLLEQEMQTDPAKQGRLGYITGLVAKSKSAAFERILFRATRGNLLFKQDVISGHVTDSTTGEKAVFVIFFSGDRAQSKISKICEAFGASRYPFPEDVSMQRQMLGEVAERLTELRTTLDAGNLHRDAVLKTIAYQLEFWISLVQREKAVYHTLNMLSIDITRKCLVAEAWCPLSASNQIQEALQRAAFDSNSQVGAVFHELQSKDLPPTYFKTNKFSGAFQDIVDAYGVGRYQEANPAVFTIITFPFLFAVMFGDWAHGIALLMASLYLILREKRLGSKKLGDIMEMAFGGRYIILLMSIFSIYTGFVYNEFFSVPFSLFGSSAYKCRELSCSDATTTGLLKSPSYTYPFGVDPVWHGSRSELPFLNSLKMKMSIVLGVIHMMLGIGLSYFNAKFFNNPLDIWYQFVPQVLFLGAMFGYLSLLIIIKWCSGSQADLYHVMIYMFLSPTADLGENSLFWGQRGIQVMLVLIAVVSVPWMLFPKPFILRKRHLEKLQGRAYGILGGTDLDSIDLDQEHEHDEEQLEEFEFGEIFVHQMIHTIEFVLGAVSNTASYLRLWALSLAHAQLSSVFYERVLLLAWSYQSIIIRLIGCLVFASATIGVLLVMETLSAFLHALRLHWVEFQNKFYQGDGYKFSPFSFSALNSDDDL
ncbi:hypothetical protein O6H91_18G023200 [Diphasiastrum complanatum]|uniref:Uncharacterized protein n=1 Tax=Diphasiastrum complanatum TaxID=34168 RepID=A0ACC2AYV7_DIPCM|nr:hypothetical protein O6H91_18G023200 [Diphasiastrum complanatum]